MDFMTHVSAAEASRMLADGEAETRAARRPETNGNSFVFDLRALDNMKLTERRRSNSVTIVTMFALRSSFMSF